MRSPPSLSPWIKSLNPLAQPSLRLFCLPYAGAGARIFRPWLHQLPPSIEICPIQLPGREDRWREPPYTCLDSLVQVLVQEIQPYLDVPFACFGHSMGALIAFELTRQLQLQRSPTPVHLFLSGRCPPHLPNLKERHTLPDPDLIQELRHLKGTPQEVLDNPELLQFFLPLIRADFSICETYRYKSSSPLMNPISIFGGRDDPETPVPHLKDWSIYTCSPLSLDLLPGDHFFLHTSRSQLLNVIANRLPL